MDATILFNARVVTLDERQPEASGLRMAGGRITHVFAGAPPAGLSGERVDLGGAVVLPGLIDAHVHLASLGRGGRELNLRGTRSQDEVLARVERAVHALTPGHWLRGRGWDQNDWPEQGFPTAGALDHVAPHHPVWLLRIDGHAVWLNSAAMALAGLSPGTPAPAGGEILRDARGQPTGVVIDNAIDVVEGALPALTAAEVRADIEEGIARCQRVGLTGVHDMGTTHEVLAALRRLDAEGKLSLRVTVYLDDRAATPEVLRTPPQRDGMLRVVGVKLFADGALGSRGAALLAPYDDRRETRGLLLMTPAALAARAARVHRAGYQLAIHAIGDRGNRVALDAIERAQGGERGRRHRVEHAQVVAPEDLPRFAALSAVASMQPTHATSDMPWAEASLGALRLAGAYAWQTLAQSGATLALGSDAPVEEENPWLGIYAAVTRQDVAGEPPQGWLPHERLSVLQALAGFTTGAAYAAHQSDLGVVRTGALADLTVVDRDPTRIAPAELLNLRTMRIFVAGREILPK